MYNNSVFSLYDVMSTACITLANARKFQLCITIPLWPETVPTVSVINKMTGTSYGLLDDGGFQQWHYLVEPESATNRFSNSLHEMSQYMIVCSLARLSGNYLYITLMVNLVYADCTWHGYKHEPTEFVIEFCRYVV